MQTDYKDIKKVVIKSQHCQRNWDLSKQVPQEDIDLLVHAVANCPSKQNIAHYKAHFITNRDVIEQVHSNTVGFARNYTDENIKYETNSQVLANLLLVFEAYDYTLNLPDLVIRNDQTQAWLENKELTSSQHATMLRDRHMAVGIAAGYVNVISTMIGYSTGCCACFDEKKVKEIINADNDILLLMGIGYSDKTRTRREHHSSDFVFPTKKKQTIIINHIN
jgi:nitroreductase